MGRKKEQEGEKKETKQTTTTGWLPQTNTAHDICKYSEVKSGREQTS